MHNFNDERALVERNIKKTRRAQSDAYRDEEHLVTRDERERERKEDKEQSGKGSRIIAKQRAS